MATANPLPPSPSPGSPPTAVRAPRRGRRLLVGILAVAVGVGVVLYARPIQQTALTGAAFGARVGCSCRYVAGRSLADCRKDLEPGMSLVLLGEDRATRSITARVPLLATQRATWHEGQGCVLEPWAQ